MKHNSLKWLYSVTGKKKNSIFFLMIIQAVHSVSGVVYALFLRNIVDSATEKNKEKFFFYVLLIMLLLLVQVALRAIMRFLEEYSRSSLENLFKQKLFHQILHKDYSRISAVHSGEWLNRLTNDTVLVANYCVDILPGITGMIVKLFSAAAMMLILDYRFFAVLFPAGIMLIFTSYGFRKVLKRLHKAVQETDGKLRIFLQEHLGSLMIIRSFSAEQQTETKASEKMSAHQEMRMKKNRFSNFCNIGFQIGMQGMYILGVVYCAYGILTDTISYGTLTAMTQLISQIQSPFANITGYLPKFYAMTASAERIMEVEQFPDDFQETPLSIQEIKQNYQENFSAIGLEQAEFSYFPATEHASQWTKTNMPIVLQNLSLEIEKGQYIAFTGHSGCGKSTVLKLLMCIYPLDGGRRYFVDNSGNRQELTSAFHRLFAYVPQGNQLISGTIREIVTFADSSGMHDDERIFQALNIACADEFVQELENGIDTLLGERGTGLSEGQMQRIAIARAIFSESPVLMLDESTSALDEKTEQKVLQNLRNMTDKTVMIVTHRPAALAICDRMIEFTQNGVIEK